MSEINSSISMLSHIHSQTADFLISKLNENGLPDFASSHGNILFQLSINGRMSMKDLAKKINRDKSTTTVLVRKLENDGFIQTESDEIDKRSKIISLTIKGKEYNQKTSVISKELLSTFYNGFTEAEKKQFFDFLKRIEGNF